MNNIIILENEQTINGKDFYVIIDIKHSNINYDINNYIKNNNRVAAYKAQLYIYTKKELFEITLSIGLNSWS
jgi:hypothetical protein